MAQRTLTTVEELDALPEGALIVCLNERGNQSWPSVFMNSGFGEPWLELDPSDRNDGEYTTSSAAVLRWSANKSCVLVWEPAQ